METLMTSLNSSAGKNTALKEASNVAKGQKAEHHAAAYFLREKCLMALELALDAGGKSAQIAVDALQLMIRDKAFHTDETISEALEQTLPMQILNSLCSLANWNSQQQCHCLTIIVQLICSCEVKIQLNAAQTALQLCMQTYGSTEEPSVRLAARAAISQMLNTYCSNKYLKAANDNSELIAVYMEVTALLDDCIKKLAVISGDQTVVVLDAIYSILTVQPVTIIGHQPFGNLLWRDLCPALVKLIGVPTNKQTGSVRSTGGDEAVGQGQSSQMGNVDRSIFDSPDIAQSLYQNCEQLIRLLAGEPEMHSVLESLFHRALLFPRTAQRMEALKTIRKMLSNPERVANLLEAAILSGKFTLWKLVLDCLVECSRSPVLDISVEAVRAVHALLNALLQLTEEDEDQSSEKFLKESLQSQILARFPDNKSATVSPFNYAIDENLKRLISVADSCSVDQDDLPVPNEVTVVEQPAAEEQAVQNGCSANEDENAKSVENEEDVKSSLQLLAMRIGSAIRDSTEIDAAEQLNERSKDEIDTSENECAEKFVADFLSNLSQFQQLKCTIEVDEAMQKFATNFYNDFAEKQRTQFETAGRQQSQFLNADAIYLTSYAALCCCVRPEMTKEYFIQQVLNNGCIVYASESWLNSVYNKLLAEVAQPAAQVQAVRQGGPVMDVIDDYDGRTHRLLVDVERLEQVGKRRQLAQHALAARRAVRWLITASWDGLLQSLARLLLSGKGKARVARPKLIEGMDNSLLGLHALAHLAVRLHLGSRSGWIFEKLVEVSCPLEDLRNTAIADEQQAKKSGKSSGNRLEKCGMQRKDALSMQIVLDNAIQCGIYAADCWKHVIRCTEYVWELEKYLYGSTGGEQNGRWSLRKRKEERKSLKSLEQEMIEPAEQSVTDVIGERDEIGDDTAAARVLCVLIAKTDRLYERMATSLNLASLCSLMQALVSASESRLQYSMVRCTALTDPCTLMNRITNIIVHLKQRPLVHLMRVWPLCTLHYIQTACARGEDLLTRTAVSCLHECVTVLITNETNGFCFNRMLFTPFQNILCVDMCAEETQDQIVSVLASFVFSHSDQIGSAWRPLFGALKAIRTSPLHGDADCVVLTFSSVSSVHATVLDVFASFLRISNRQVLRTAMLDCITCLVHYLQAIAPRQDEDGVDDQPADELGKAVEQDTAIAESTLEFLQQIHRILHGLFENPQPHHVPYLLHRLLLRERGADCVDADVAYLETTMDAISDLSADLMDTPFFASTGLETLSSLQLGEQFDVPDCPLPWHEMNMSRQCTIELWLSLIEGMTAVVVTCPRSLQSKLLLTLGDMTNSFMQQPPGMEFAGYCLVHLILPMLQKWLRREGQSGSWRENSSSVRNFKQSVGLFADLVVGYVQQGTENLWSQRVLLDCCQLLNECIAQPSEPVARLGLSCLKHLINTGSNCFNAQHWMIISRSLWNTTCITLHPIRLLMSHFFIGSNDYNGDIGSVQVALRSDSNSRQAARILLLAQQVFLLDDQKQGSTTVDENPDALNQADRSVIFVLNPAQSADGLRYQSASTVHRLAFRDVTVSLLGHQLLLQLIGTLLLDGSELSVQGVAGALLKQTMHGDTVKLDKLPGKLADLPISSITTLLLCIDASFQVAHQFDSRPGLKFLLQKVFNSNLAANLYRQTATAWAIRYITMYEMARRAPVTGKQMYAWFDLDNTNLSLNFDKDDRYIFRLSDSVRRICRELARMEKASALERIPAIMRQTSEKPFAFVKDKTTEEDLPNGTDDEIIYSFVSSDKIAGYRADYKKQKTMTAMPAVPLKDNNNASKKFNPFFDSVNHVLSKTDEEILINEQQKSAKLKDVDVRCAAWVEMAALPIQLLLAEQDEVFKKMLPVLYPPVTQMAAGSAEPQIRHLIADFLTQIAKRLKFLEYD